MKFKYKCPNCQATEKVVDKCKKCWKYTCSECSVNSLCIDCYVHLNGIKEKKIYQEDKIRCLTKTY